MRLSWTRLAVFAAAGFAWAGSAGAQVINFANTTTRFVEIRTEDSDCTNPSTAAEGSPAVKPISAGCLVFANNPAADFTDLDTDFFGTLQFVGGTTWRLTVSSAVWGQVVATTLTSSGATFGSATDNRILFDTATGVVTPDPAGPGAPAYWTGTASFGAIPLDLSGAVSPVDNPVFASAPNPLAPGQGVPLTFSCVDLIATTFPGPVSSTAFGGPTNPGLPYCGVSTQIPQPGFVNNVGAGKTTISTFTRSRISITDPGPPVQVFQAIPDVFAPLDWQILEVADTDGDGFPNPFDNCPYIANPTQADSGGVNTNVPDGIGNACQCGDVSGDGRVNNTDSVQYARGLAVPPTAPCTGGPGSCSAGAAGRCNVNAAAACSSADLVIIRRNLLIPPVAPAITQTCSAALP